jgi:hypothetical protein
MTLSLTHFFGGDTVLSIHPQQHFHNDLETPPGVLLSMLLSISRLLSGLFLPLGTLLLPGFPLIGGPQDSSEDPN